MSRFYGRMLQRVGLLPLLAHAGLTSAQVADCPTGRVPDPLAYLQSQIEPGEDAKDALKDEPRVNTPAEKTGAPSNNSASTSTVTSPAFTEALKLVWEDSLVSTQEGVATVDLNLFAFKAARHDFYTNDQWLYDTDRNRLLRRFGGSLSFGGKGEKFDRDGDGNIDDPLQAEAMGDIVTYELHWRLFGSRDRREVTNYQRYFAAPASRDARDSYMALIAEAAQAGRLIAWLNGTNIPDAPEVTAPISPLRDPNGCYSEKAIDQWIRAREDSIKAASERVLRSGELRQALLDSIDGAPILTFAGGGIERKEDFGTDERYVGLRFAWDVLESELEYRETSPFEADVPDAETWKLGAKVSGYFLRDILPAADGALVSFALSYEMFDDVPGVLHDTIAKATLKTEYKVNDAITVPISLTWANHEDLLSDESEIRGHFGLSYDLGDLMGN